jgi:hypothetical protein
MSFWQVGILRFGASGDSTMFTSCLGKTWAGTIYTLFIGCFQMDA